jgi:hypothetical protein
MENHKLLRLLKSLTEAIERGEYDIVLSECNGLSTVEIANILIELQDESNG